MRPPEVQACPIWPHTDATGPDKTKREAGSRGLLDEREVCLLNDQSPGGLATCASACGALPAWLYDSDAAALITILDVSVVAVLMQPGITSIIMRTVAAERRANLHAHHAPPKVWRLFAQFRRPASAHVTSPALESGQLQGVVGKTALLGALFEPFIVHCVYAFSILFSPVGQRAAGLHGVALAASVSRHPVLHVRARSHQGCYHS
jgi:hypothetical protein